MLNVQRHKAIIIIAGLLSVCVLLYLFFSNFNQTKQVSVNPQEKIAVAKVVEDISNVTVVEEKDQQEEMATEPDAGEESQLEYIATAPTDKEDGHQGADDNSVKKTITEEIKEKIKEVVEGTINLFKKDLEIVSIGDSLTQGVGDETESGGYVGILNHTFADNNVNIKIENYGKRGNRTDQLLKRLDKEEIASSISKADIVLITIGANDIMKVVKSNITNLTLEPFDQERVNYIKRLRAIFNKINELNPDTQIYLIGFYNPFEYFFGDIKELGMIMDSWNNAGKDVTEEFENVHYIPTADLFMNTNIELLAEDFFHPNTSGYKLIAQRVLEDMKEIDVETEVVPEDLLELNVETDMITEESQ